MFTKAIGAIVCWIFSNSLHHSAARTAQVEVPFLETARFILSLEGPKKCAEFPDFDNCKDPWASVEVWRYAVSNVLAVVWREGHMQLKDASSKAAVALTRFFSEPAAHTLQSAGEQIRALTSTLTSITSTGGDQPEHVMLQTGTGLGVPFPAGSVLLQRHDPGATLQLKNGFPMPLLALAIRSGNRPSIASIVSALRLGIRHLEVSPASVKAVAAAIGISNVPPESVFLSVTWSLPIDSEDQLDSVLETLGRRHIDLLQLPRGPNPEFAWNLLQTLKAKGKVMALGVKDFSPEEVDSFSKGGASVDYAQCRYTPYRPGTSRSLWMEFGRRSIALATSGLLTDWPRMLSPMQDPHVKAVAHRSERTAAQVLIRWALQLGLSVVFRASSHAHLAENTAVFDFELPDSEMQLLNGLATLA